MDRDCAICGTSFSFCKSREKTAFFCSRACAAFSRMKGPNTKCCQCGKEYRVKPSLKAKNSQVLGEHCSRECLAKSKAEKTVGSKNPNYRGRTTDSDGYKLFSPQASLKLGLGKIKEHQAICCIELGLTSIKVKGTHVHHRDCDILNNSADNLVILTISDHKWLHKQYGNATLWANRKGKISTEELVSWSDNKDKARRLLSFSVIDQAKDRSLLPAGFHELLESRKMIRKL